MTPDRGFELARPASGLVRVLAVWKRFRRVYFKFLLANMIPPVLEPLFFILGLGVGLSAYLGLVDGVEYAVFLAPGMMAISPMWSASFETTYGTYMRMEYEHIYDAILASPVSFGEMMLGETLWVSSKAAAFSLVVVGVTALFGLVHSWWALLVPVAGFVTGAIYALMGIIVTSKVREINNFNFYMTGVLTPQFYFCGAVFPLEQLPPLLRSVCYVLPLTHVVELMRSFCLADFHSGLWINVVVCLAWAAVLWPLAERLLRRRIVV
ncbi:MAG: ABC transporter [Candidatus Glassbacteria bacterium]|nr:ABC transporter [Candidatus Glassbacteria bacterium]